MNRLGLLGALLVAAGGCAETPLHAVPQQLAGHVEASAGQLATTDAGAIGALLHHSVGYGGLHFADAACQARFPAPRVIEEGELDAFAACLAGLHLAVSPRHDQVPDFAVLSYAPGIEVEARFAIDDRGAELLWIGYAGNVEGGGMLPAITPEALRALRQDGADQVTDPAAAAALEAEAKGKRTGAALRVCLDTAGAPTVHVDAGMPQAAAAFTTLVAGWHFRPFVLDGQATPACAQLELSSPGATAVVADGERVVPPLDPAGGVNGGRVRTAGDPLVTPTPVWKVALEQTKLKRISGTVRVCADAAGHVTDARTYTSTRVPAYDQALVAAVRGFAYTPAATTSCFAQTFVYEQR